MSIVSSEHRRAVIIFAIVKSCLYNFFTGYVTESRSPNVSCTAILNRTNDTSVEWWSLSQDDDYIVDPMIYGQLEMIIYSEKVAPQIFSIISGFG